MPYPWLSLFSHISCSPRRRFAKVNASVVSDAVITYTGRRRGRTGEDRQGAASCLPLTPAGGGRAGQGSGPPAPGTCCGASAGPLFRDKVREKGRSISLPSFCVGRGWGKAAARLPAGTTGRSHSAFSRQSVLFGKDHLCSSSTASALEGWVQLGLGRTAQM